MYSHQLVTDQLNLELDDEKSKTSSNNMYLEEQQMSTTYRDLIFILLLYS